MRQILRWRHNGCMEPNFNRQAEELIAQGRYSDARELLVAAIQEMPNHWTPEQEDGGFPAFYFWNADEFMAFGRQETRRTESFVWVEDSYSRAWYLLAVVASKEQRLEHALVCIDCGLELEPDHPELWNEKGFVLGRLKRHQEALECYVRAASVREWAPSSQIARALRGQGIQLVDLDRLDEAEDTLRRSLKLEPDSQTAHNELGFIEELRQKREAEKEAIPWFLHSFVNPPSDPLTIQLLALVGDLPSIPGPKTAGADNYSRISDAFMKRGWAGFEEEFDRIVPRDRADYADVKRDLLREPIFSLEAHRNLADAVLGDRTVDEIFDEMEQSEENPRQ